MQAVLDLAGLPGALTTTVFVPQGTYRFDGMLRIPEGVTLCGASKSVPSHNGVRDCGLPHPMTSGTTFLVCSGADDENATPFLTLSSNATAKRICFYYPDQNPDAEPTPYPWCIAMRGKNPAVLECELLNPYLGIDATHNERHMIRNISGQPLKTGIYIDAIYDIGRVENVHFNPWWCMNPKLMAWQMKNGVAFRFARTDWQYVLNTFCFGSRIDREMAFSEFSEKAFFCGFSAFFHAFSMFSAFQPVNKVTLHGHQNTHEVQLFLRPVFFGRNFCRNSAVSMVTAHL